MRSIFKMFKKILDIIFGSRVDFFYWKFRHFIDPTWAESYVSEESLNHPHRKLLVDVASKYAPFDSLFEMGCASGPNLFLLTKRFPNATFSGIDISKRAIDTGNAWFAKKNIKNVSLSVGGFDFLTTIPDASFDIVMSDAALLYADSKEIEAVVHNMIRISKKSVILVEQHTDGDSFYNSHWIHNYKKIAPSATFTKIPPELWAGDWGTYGYIIEISCPQK